jgi:hypothetical protein
MRLTILGKDFRVLENKNGVGPRWERVIRLEYIGVDSIHTISMFHGHSAMALAAA